MTGSNGSRHTDNNSSITQVTTSSKSLTVFRPFALATVLSLSAMSITGCGYNKLQEQDVDIDNAWENVVVQYQRREKLIPDLVEVTKQYANQEKEVFTQVTQARSQISGMKVTAEVLNDPQSMKKYQEAQAQMGSALSRLMAISESYPQLKSDTIFIGLQEELAGTENRIAVERKRYNDKVSEYNKTVRKFPTNITAKAFGMQTKANFSEENEVKISSEPQVNFSNDQ